MSQMRIRIPKVRLDPAGRFCVVTQAHPTLIGQDQTVILPFSILKQILIEVLVLEATAELATGDAMAVPPGMPTTGDVPPEANAEPAPPARSAIETVGR